MKKTSVTDKIKSILEPKRSGIKARIFVTREDGITIYDTIQDATTTSVAALVSGVWQASEALMGLVRNDRDVMDFRLGFDTSSQGIYLFPFSLSGNRYFLGAIYNDCLNPGQLKRQVAMLKEELSLEYANEEVSTESTNMTRDGYLFHDITDEEMDRLFSIGGN